MPDLQNTLNGLQEKVQLLLKRFALVEKENAQLKIALANQSDAVRALEHQLKEGQAQLAASMMRSSNSLDAAEKEKWAQKIDQYIKEIDSCIQQLSA